MSQRWFFFAGMLIIASARSASSVSGSCASIGYSSSCCPLSEEYGCQANDGYCFCSPDCHTYDDCCEDAHCPAEPRTCADVGITQCCTNPSGNGHCDVHFRDSDNNRCSCNASCHERNDCCPDALMFCEPDSCTGAGKYDNPSCCNRVNASACYVPGGNCYCDPLCTLYHDCCDDAETRLEECRNNRFSRMRLQSIQKFNDRGLGRQRFNNRERRIHQQRGNINYVYQEAPVGRAQREFMND